MHFLEIPASCCFNQDIPTARLSCDAVGTLSEEELHRIGMAKVRSQTQRSQAAMVFGFNVGAFFDQFEYGGVISLPRGEQQLLIQGCGVTRMACATDWTSHK